MKQAISELSNWRRRRLAVLWLTESCDADSASALLALNWSHVWSAMPPNELASVVSNTAIQHKVLNSRSEVPPDGYNHSFQFIYNVSKDVTGTESAIIRERRVVELENLVEGWMGGIVVAGEASGSLLEFLEALAPKATVFNIRSDEVAGTDNGVLKFAQELAVTEEENSYEEALVLKDASNVRFDTTLLEPLSDAWELITKRVLQPSGTISQEDFDGFLSGDRGWRCVAAGAALARGPICHADDKTKKKDPIAELLQTIQSVDSDQVDPNEAITRLRIFAETGSGCSTLLKQAAIEVARAGYPVLISRPFPRKLRTRDIIRLIINVQDAWLEQRSGSGSGTGNLPFCVILDSDAELPAHAESFVRSLSTDLNRKLVIVTAHRRSRSEIEVSKGTLKLNSVSSEDEMLSLGQNLRNFSERWGLARIPTEAEWKIYYGNFGVMKTHSPLAIGGVIDTPALFLIGLYPFTRERVRDQRGLSRYLYTKWFAIHDDGLKKAVEVFAAASVYGCAVPLECAIREPSINEALTSKLTKEDDRIGDFFFEWARFGGYTYNWALHMRHPAMGLLLLRALSPEEALAPHSVLTALIGAMTGSSADVWFAEEISYRLGKNFRSSSDRFSLEVDTPIQGAARAIFDAIPESVAGQSRVIKHHHARYYIHLLHACLDVMRDPSSTSVPRDTCQATAIDALSRAMHLIEEAQDIPSEREGISYLLTSLAAAAARLAVGISELSAEISRPYFDQAIDLSARAINEDVANGHAIFTYVNSIQKLFEAIDLSEISAEEALKHFVGAEDRIHTLLDLRESRQWRNVEDGDAEYSLFQLIEAHNMIADRLSESPVARELIAKTPGARAAIELRTILMGDSIRQAFSNTTKTTQLRNLRGQLIDDEFFNELLDLRYRLFVCDPIDRFEFGIRNEILNDMARRLPDEYVNFLHDHAAIAFQLEQIDRSNELFRDIRARKASNPNQWFWHNERIFVSQASGQVSARRVVVRITDAVEGWATYDGRARVKIQPRQWGEIEVGSYLNVFIRFRIAGLQGIDKRLADYDLQAIGAKTQNPAAER